MTLCPANQILGPCGGLREPVEEGPMDARSWLRMQAMKVSWALGAPGLTAALEGTQALTQTPGAHIPTFKSQEALFANLGYVRYVPDAEGFDYMKHPGTTWAVGGDCEDFTAAVLASLWRSGLMQCGYMLNMHWEMDGRLVGHSAALWRDLEGQARMGSNWPRFPMKVASVEGPLAALSFEPDTLMALRIPMVSVRQDGVVCFGKPERVL